MKMKDKSMNMTAKGGKMQMSESIVLALILAVVGGYLDAYTYGCRDGVFANAQTGNIVHLGMALASGRWLDMLKFLIPVITFSVGVILALLIRKKWQKQQDFHWRQLCLVMEMLILILVAFIPVSTNWNIFANILVALICAIQVETFRKVDGRPFASTMCTGNLRSGTEALYQYIATKETKYLRGSLLYFNVILFFILGVMIGVFATGYLMEKAVLVLLVPLLACLGLMFKK